jgi:hypothetical protein
MPTNRKLLPEEDPTSSTALVPALAFELLGAERVLVSYQGARPGRPEEWNRYLDVMASIPGGSRMRYLVYHDGPPPSLRDQQRIGAIARPQKPLVSLISSSTTLRFVVSAFSLVTRQIRFFSPDELLAALLHLELGAREQRAVVSAVERLRSQVESKHSSIRDLTPR